jgi:hypothetical protein
MQFRFRRTRIFVAFVLLLVFVEAAGLLLHPARADSYGTANARLFYDSNVSNADETDDIRSDSGLDFGVTSATLYDLESLGLLRISGSFDGASYARYVGLDHLGLAGDLALKRKIGLGASAPWLQLESSLAHDSYSDDVRDGWTWRALAGAGKLFWNSVRLEANVGIEKRTQDHVTAIYPGVSGAVFQQFNRVGELRAEASISEQMSIFSQYMVRAGGANLTVQGRPAQFGGDALATTADPALGPRAFAEKIRGLTHSLALGVSYSCDSKSVLSLMVRRQITSEQGGDEYDKTEISLSYVHEL